MQLAAPPKTAVTNDQATPATIKKDTASKQKKTTTTSGARKGGAPTSRSS